MSRGLGKTERWVLIHIYRKTVKHTLPDTWRLPERFVPRYRLEGEPETLGPLRKKLHVGSPSGKLFWSCLFKAEVLLNLFRLDRSFRLNCFVGYGFYVEGEGYPDNSDFTRTTANSAKVAYSRVKKSLLCKELIQVQRSYDANMEEIRLTKAGRAIAQSLSSN